MANPITIDVRVGQMDATRMPYVMNNPIIGPEEPKLKYQVTFNKMYNQIVVNSLMGRNNLYLFKR